MYSNISKSKIAIGAKLSRNRVINISNGCVLNKIAISNSYEYIGNEVVTGLNTATESDCREGGPCDEIRQMIGRYEGVLKS